MNSFRRHSQNRPSRILFARRSLAAAILLVAAGAARAQQTLEIRRAVLASGPTLLLKELVRSPAELPQGWAERPVLSSPLPCKSQRYPLSAIAYALQCYPDMKKVTLRGDLNVTARRDGMALDTVLVEDAVRQYVAKQKALSNASIEVELVRVPLDLRVPLGGVEIQVTDSKILDAALGDSSFELRIAAQDSTLQTASVQARIRPLREFWVARGPLEKGRVLGLDDIERKLCSEDRVSHRYVPCIESVQGLELNRNLRPGQPIARDSLSRPRCVGRGEQVRIVAELKNLRIALRAKALSDGRLGERILCLNEQSKRRLVVQMTGPQAAELIRF